MRTLLARVAQLAAADDEWLSEHGQDRTYSALRHLLAESATALEAGRRSLDASDALSAVQRAFAARMLDASVFTKQLAAVRELRIALDRLADLPDGPARDARVPVSRGRAAAARCAQASGLLAQLQRAGWLQAPCHAPDRPPATRC